MLSLRFISDFKPVRWVWLYLMGMLSIMDFLPEYILHLTALQTGVLMATVPALKASIINVVYSLLERRRGLVWMGPTIVVIYSILAIVNALCYALYGFGISRRMMMVIVQTNPEETAGFLPGLTSNLHTLLTSAGFWCPILLCALLAFIWVRAVKLYPVARKWIVAVVAVLSLAGVGALGWFAVTHTIGRSAFFMSVRIPQYLSEIIRSEREFEKVAAKRRPLQDADKVRSSRDADILFIVGESAEQRHLQAYGYPLPTSPRLASAKDSVILFDHAIGSSVQTHANMERILTFMPDDSGERQWYEYPLMLALLNKAGYTTWWISMQDRAGVFSDNTEAIASDAQNIRHLGMTTPNDYFDNRFDEAAIPVVEEALQGAGPKFVGLHLIGSHHAYQDRIPPDRGHITAADVMRAKPRKWLTRDKAQTIADYDNSIAYTDSILGVLTDYVARLKRPTVVVYFTDHGDNVYDDRDFVGRDVKYVRVPLFFYCNPAYRSAYPGLVKAMRDASGRRMSTANLIHTILTLTGTHYPAYDATLDVLSPRYRERTFYVDDAPYQW